MSKEKVAQTVVLELDTSNRKNEKIQRCIDEYQEMSNYISNLIVSFNEHQWSTMNPQFYRNIKKKYKDNRYVSASVSLEAIEDVVGGYKSWKSNGKVGNKPTFGNSNYVRCKSKQITIERSEKNYGIKFNIVPYNPEWFSIKINPYSEKYMDKILNDEASFGTCEIHRDGDRLFAHLVVTWEVEVLDSDDAENIIGIDLNEKNIYSLAVLNESGFENIFIKNGREFRHYRERLKSKRKQMMAKDDLKGVKECSGEHERYTEHVLHSASRSIISTASSYSNSKIVLEDLTGYRNSARRPIHDWPFALFQEMIMYKAKAKGIPVELINPRNTSKMCRHCSHISDSNRNGDDFKCVSCGYEVHADVNAAMNIAFRGSDFNRDDFGIVKESNIKNSLFEY